MNNLGNEVNVHYFCVFTLRERCNKMNTKAYQIGHEALNRFTKHTGIAAEFSPTTLSNATGIKITSPPIDPSRE